MKQRQRTETKDTPDMQHGGFLPPGTRVRLDSLVNDDADADAVTPEFGVVIHCWLNREIDAFDCYVAVFGDRFPEGPPPEKPYVLRYAATSLTVAT